MPSEMRHSAAISGLPSAHLCDTGGGAGDGLGARQEIADLESANPPLERRARITGARPEDWRQNQILPYSAGRCKPKFRAALDVRPDAAPPWPVATTGGRSVPTKTEPQLIAEIADTARSRIPRSIDWLLEICNCESPIERVMLVAIYSFLRFATPMPVVYWSDGKGGMVDNQGPDHIMIYTQAPVGSYRVDILIVSTFSDGGKFTPIKIVVECDGHDFHERTKAQASKDKARDRELQAGGMRVFRFTGSEIWGAPNKCAREVCLALLCLINKPVGI